MPNAISLRLAQVNSLARPLPSSGLEDCRGTLGEDLAAVNDEGLARDVRRLGGREEERRVPDVLDRPEALLRDARLCRQK